MASRNPKPWGDHHTFVDYMIQCDGPLFSGFMVPQKSYDLGQPFRRLPSIKFFENNAWGINMQNAVDKRLQGMGEPSYRPVLSENAKKVTIRILWPGYEEWHDVIHVYDHAYDQKPIKMEQLVIIIGRKVKLFLEDMKETLSSDSSPDWWVSCIDPGRLLLLELRHVSPGSWQPVFSLLLPTTTPAQG